MLCVTIIPTIIHYKSWCVASSSQHCLWSHAWHSHTQKHTHGSPGADWGHLWSQQGHVQTYRSTNAHICTCDNTAYSSSVIAGSSRNPPCWAKCYFSAWLDSCIRSHGQAHTKHTHTLSTLSDSFYKHTKTYAHWLELFLRRGVHSLVGV